MQNISQKTIRKILLLVGALALIGLIIIIIYTKLTAPKTASISNINVYLKDYKSNNKALNIVEKELYNTITYNTSSDPSKLSDIKVRNNSFSQEKNGSVYTNSFIVDIDSLKQSYRISYQWDESDDSGDTLDEWGNNVTCLTDDDKIIYPDFDCTDDFINNLGTDDPIAKILPYIEVGKYKIYAEITDKKISSINIDIYSCIDKTADKYLASAMDWLSSQKITPPKYTINTNFCVTN